MSHCLATEAPTVRWPPFLWTTRAAIRRDVYACGVDELQTAARKEADERHGPKW